MIRISYFLALLAAGAAFASPVHAIDMQTLLGLKPTQVIEVPDPTDQEDTYEITISAVNIFKVYGIRLYEIVGKSKTGDEQLIVDFAANPVAVGVVDKDLTLKDVHLKPKRLYKIDSQGKGQINLGDKVYNYSSQNTDDANYLPAGDETKADKVSFYEFLSDDEEQSVFIVEWEDGSFNVSHLVYVEPADISVLP